jgi:hypothetical protein
MIKKMSSKSAQMKYIGQNAGFNLLGLFGSKIGDLEAANILQVRELKVRNTMLEYKVGKLG